jgi:hypothetical protein
VLLDYIQWLFRVGQGTQSKCQKKKKSKHTSVGYDRILAILLPAKNYMNMPGKWQGKQLNY